MKINHTLPRSSYSPNGESLVFEAPGRTPEALRASLKVDHYGYVEELTVWDHWTSHDLMKPEEAGVHIQMEEPGYFLDYVKICNGLLSIGFEKVKLNSIVEIEQC